MDIQLTEEAHRTTALITGEADADNCTQLGETLLSETTGQSLALDLSGLTFLDSSAVSELLRVQRALAEREVSMSIVSPSPAVRRILEITGLLDLFGITKS